ncbi:MAG: Lrp/AsnC family transcriptional regulator [Pseudomonadota bacterium]
MSQTFDHIDMMILTELQRDSAQSQRTLGDRIGLSQNACWRRLRALEESGVIKGRTVVLDRARLGAGLVVFVMVRTRHHSTEWLQDFRTHVAAIAEVVDFFRIGGDYDYLLKVITRDMASYDAVYQRLIAKVELETVTSYFAMEAIAEQRPIPLG